MVGYLVAALLVPGVACAASDTESPTYAGQDNFGSPSEPSNLLPEITQRRKQKDSMFPASPLGWLHDSTGKAKQGIKDATGLKLGVVFAHLFQGLSDTIDGDDKSGMATTFDMLGTWDLIDEGEPTQGQAVFQVQSRWDYGTTGPEDLGASSLGSLIGTGDTFARYPRALVLRNLYWRQGSPEAGWSYRLGKITPDGILSASAYLDSQQTFLPTGSVTSGAIAFPDSGLGAVGAWYLSDRATLVGLVSNANADRFNVFGFDEVGEGDVFAAAEFHMKIAPRTEKAPWSKLTVWHTDGTEDGAGVNAMTGKSGWGFYLLHEQELSADGRAIGIARYGRSYNESAVYEQQAGVHFLLYDPGFATNLKHDVVGTAFNWARSPEVDTRDEYNLEVFYRFPLFPNVDTSLSYQYVINPAFTTEVDSSSVFSLRFRTVF
jgi:carbohydrate-selective porin OprB